MSFAEPLSIADQLRQALGIELNDAQIILIKEIFGKKESPIRGFAVASTRIWKAINKVEWKDQENETIDINFWTVTPLFIRPCYLKLYDIIFGLLGPRPDRPYFIITGTPGIGKTMFLYYVMCKLVAKAKTQGKRIIIVVQKGLFTEQFELFDTDSNITFLTCNLGNVISLVNEQRSTMPESQFYYLCHSSIPNEVLMESLGTTILATSPDRKIYKNFKKAGAFMYFMPIWSWDEIQGYQSKKSEVSKCLNMKQVTADIESLSLTTTSHEETVKQDPELERITRLYKIVGGIPRHLFKSNQDIESEIEDAILTHSLDALVQNISESDIKDQASRLLLYYNVQEDYFHKTVEFGSEYIKQRILDRLSRADRTLLKRFVEAGERIPTFAGTRGKLFDKMGLEVLCKGGSFLISPLFRNSNYRSNMKITLPPVEIRKFEKLEDIAECKSGHYYLPNKATFPSIDSFLAPNIVFQLTVSLSHYVTATSNLNSIFQLLQTRFPNMRYLNFIWVVPKEQYYDFKWQNYKEKSVVCDSKTIEDMDSKIQQWVLQLSFVDELSPASVSEISSAPSVNNILNDLSKAKPTRKNNLFYIS